MNVTFWPCNKVPSSQLIHNNDLQYCTCTKWQKNANLFDLQIHVILDLLCHPLLLIILEAAQRTSLSHCGKKTSFLGTQIFLAKAKRKRLCLLRALWHFKLKLSDIMCQLFVEFWYDFFSQFGLLNTYLHIRYKYVFFLKIILGKKHRYSFNCMMALGL